MADQFNRIDIPGVSKLSDSRLNALNPGSEEFIPDLFNALISIFRDTCGSDSEFHSVFLCGGGSVNEQITDILRNAPFIAHQVDNAAFASAKGGRTLLSDMALDGFVVDIGEAAIKILCGTRYLTYARDFKKLPLTQSTTEDEHPKYRVRFREYLSACIADAIDRSDSINQLAAVVAIPACLKEHCIPGPSSYPGLAGDAFAISDSFSISGFSDITLYGASDVELAAVGVLDDPTRSRRANSLVATIGRSVHAATIQPILEES
jgi:hypothetical protein